MSDRHAPDQLTRDGQPLLTRAASIQPTSFNPEKRTSTLSLGSGAPVLRYDWASDSNYYEVLSMESGHVRLERLNAGAGVFEDHLSQTVQKRVGRFIPKTVKVVNGEIVGEVQWSRAKRHEDTVGDIADGIISDTSIGYHVYRWEISRDDVTGIETRTAVDWEPLEGSVVGVPADFTGGIRSAETTTKAPPAPESPVAADTRTGTPSHVRNTMDEQEKIQAALDAEQARQDGIRGLATKAGIAEEQVRELLTDRSVSVEQAAVRLWDIRAKADEANTVRTHIAISRDEGDTQFRAISQAMEAKAGVGSLTDLSAHLRGATSLDLAKLYLGIHGVRTTGMTPYEIAKAARHTRAVAAHKTTDFTSVYANVGFKSFMAAYTALPELNWWKDLGLRNDFKSMTHPRYVVKVSGMGLLPHVDEGAAYQGTTQVDSHELVTPDKRGYEFRVTDEMIVDDDIGFLLRKSAEYGDAAVRTESSIALAAFSANLVDGNPVFHSTRANLSTSGGAPDLTKIAELDTMLRVQTDGNGNVIGRGAKIALLPESARTVMEQIYSDRLYAADPTDLPTVPLERRYIPGLATAWMLATGNRIACEYGWLQGEGGPAISNYEQPGNDATVYHIRDVFGFGVIDPKQFSKNPGA